ncbi:nucleotide exchange factor GrpE [Candidatus Roizmanbacteria bacterium RIFCSPLOWO2_01_FULL_37_12]|uniref:Protein GrpE n=1 Tax=Candidatus Roizmanbacteria bacterium RIFCSPLOWO2_01_FULL_37_12 TaxID=1802056 RepID=A0A1F7I8V3_9BACT|nr:MAG: nucleotide exchange factor GrpE [Candidatus Roizmanbacteria bacterium RIFCSPHIGHO2_01_FULL_37_16]OGK23026.1 MAG: nucleotide exchange factor GrpE [Candidatus Roizmanbacteria bacterium RIFCSPHIGHO2_02_FULL_37_9b]OGK39790.1 MAG: nucleotide exchange factor GrpE [Candidatus Roizmanbacteria bacterium RIFCSPLOWO2_01_FULL_37_12]
MDQKVKKEAKPAQDIEKIKKENEELKKQIEDFKNKYLRALADYQNYEKRVKVEKDQVSQTVTKNVLLKLLPFLDNLDKAQAFVKDNGLKMIKDNFFKALQEIGLEEIQVLGKPFDPYTAEAIDIVEGKDDNIIVEVLRKGYKYKGQILRVAQAKVSKKVSNN